jgi:hypothetical protein
LTPTQVLGQMLSRAFGSGELGPYAEARDKKDFEALWEFLQVAGDEILEVTSERCRQAFEKLTWQAVLIFAASHRHWKNVLAVPGSADDWASWSDARRQEWLAKVRQKPTTLPTAEVKRRNKKNKKRQQRSRSKSAGRDRVRSPRVVVVKQTRSRTRSRSRRRSRSRSRSRQRSPRRVEARHTDGSRDNGRREHSRERSERARSRSRRKEEGSRVESYERRARSRSRRVQRSGDEEVAERRGGWDRRRGRSRTRRNKPICVDCGGEHYADDEAFHPDHPKAVRYDVKGSPRRR